MVARLGERQHKGQRLGQNKRRSLASRAHPALPSWGVTPFLRAIRGPSALLGAFVLSADGPSWAQQSLEQVRATAGSLVEAAQQLPNTITSGGVAPAAGGATAVSAPSAAPAAAARLMDSYELCQIGRLGQHQLSFLTVFILIGCFIFFLQIDHRLIKHGWEIRKALSEPTNVSYIPEDGSKKPLLNEKGEAVSIRVMEPSVSRLIALAGLIMLILFYFGFGIISVYHFGRTCEMPGDINGVTTFLYAGLTFFAPYIATKFSEVFAPTGRRLPLPSVQPPQAQAQPTYLPQTSGPATVIAAPPQAVMPTAGDPSATPTQAPSQVAAPAPAPAAPILSTPPPAAPVAAPAASVSGAHPDAFRLIRDFEGFADKAYPDPASGGDPWTIGYGFTRVNGKPVVPGQTMSHAEADQLLSTMVGEHANSLSGRIPFWKDMADQQQSALISFAWNLGLGFYGDETNFHTISTCLRNKDWAKVPDALLLYCMPGTPVHQGLLRRRQEEGKVWRQGMAAGHAKPAQAAAVTAAAVGNNGAPARPIAAGGTAVATAPATAVPPAVATPAKPNPLQVAYFDQMLMDDGQGWRDCFSASCAMLAYFWGKLKAKDGNAYNHIRQKYGDSTDSNAQLQALRSLGLHPEFRTDGKPENLKAEIDAGRPVAVGWLHHGHVTAPSGGGHWTVVIGYDDRGFWMNDPYGSCDLVGGSYPGGGNPNDEIGKRENYSYKNWLPRWMPAGSAGWYLTCKP
ncbi:MAG: C39 family peptidase [Cyanobacteriota bacterium]|nr:C39 family peptidase [Cyanobacteriota bacterium]